jgi:hypothetical protein
MAKLAIFRIALLHGFSHVHCPANPTLAVYHLATIVGSHPDQKPHLAVPFYLAFAMVFHA